jgi:hypothetical protein
MMAELQRERTTIRVRPLPGRVSIAGEWYLGMPAYSAATDVGLSMIRLLTSREAEIDRVHHGVGLPTRTSYYSGPTDVSPYFSIDFDSGEMPDLVQNSFPRSRFGCYVQFAGILRSHLRSILEIPDGADVSSEIRSSFQTLDHKMDFVRPQASCARCSAQVSESAR